MSTRGAIGFRKNGEDKLTYNHSDSYPSWLGSEVVKFLNSTDIDELNAIYDRIILIDRDVPPTPEQIKACEKFYNSSVDNGKIDNWYCLLRETQGSLSVYKDPDLLWMIGDNSFIFESLFCEYAYIINLDDNVLEFYTGFQHEKDPTNRYNEQWQISRDEVIKELSKFAADGDECAARELKHTKESIYYPCKLLCTFKLEDFPMDVSEVVNIMEKAVRVDNGEDDENENENE